MDHEDAADLARDLRNSAQMRTSLEQRLSRNEFVDLIKEWETLERLDHEIARKIRKRSPE